MAIFNKNTNLFKCIPSAILGYVLHFPLRLLEDAVTSWVNGQIAQKVGNLMPFILWVTRYLWSWVLPFLCAIVVIWLAYWLRHKDRRKSQANSDNRDSPIFKDIKTYLEDKGFDNGERVSECGLIFTNTCSANLDDCQARLIDLEYETPHKEYGLQNYPKAEDLICAKSVPAFGTAKIPLFRWKGNCIDNRLDIVYQNKNEHGVANEPILVLLNIWATNTPAIYVVCKLAKGKWTGFDLSVIKTGLQKDNLSLATFQKPNPHKEGSQS